ncbi:MAG: InlB B-repeat-containing protein [Solirubrobacterales bacterium]
MFRRFAVVLLVPLVLLLGASAAQAANSQNGADMVVINPGGGQALDGSDGLLSVFNGENNSNPNFFGGTRNFADNRGSDQQFFASTVQWCCDGAGPILYAGLPTPVGDPNPNSVFIGEAGAAATRGADSWSATTGTGTPSTGGVEIVSTSGAVVRVPAGGASNAANFPANAPTGSGTAVIRYTGIVDNRAYVIDRAISYTYPKNFYTETYTFTVPSGNAYPVQFYLGGDASPGDQDSGTQGAMTTTPNRVLYEINPTSQIYVAYGEVGSPATNPFSSGWAGDYDGPYGAIERGQTLVEGNPCPSAIIDSNFCVDTSGHDAGLDIQWTIPSTPGSYTRQMRTIVGFQGQSVGARFNPSSVAAGQSAALEIDLLNTTFSPVSGIGFSLALPAGLSVSGSATNSCGGTLTAASGATSVSLSGGSLAAGANCLVSVPVEGAVGTYTVNDQDFQNLAPGTLSKGFGASSLEVVAPSEQALTVTKSGGGSGTVQSDPTGIDCGETCSANFPTGSPVTLTATAASGSTFTGWSGAGCSGTGTCEVTMSEAKSVDATFTADSPTPPPADKPDLKVSLTAPKRVTGGKSFGVKLKVTNRAGGVATSRAVSPRAGVEARSVKTCLTIPSPLITIKAKGSKINGRTACWTRSTLGSGKSVTYSATVKAPRSASGSKSLKATVQASDTAGDVVDVTGRAKVKVKKAEPPKPKPPTG